MKFFKWLKTLFRKLEKKTVSNVERLELEIDKMKNCLKNIEESYYKSKGKEKSLLDRLEELNQYKKELKEGAKKVIENADDSMLLRIKKELEVQEVSIQDISKNIDICKNITEKLYQQKNILSSEFSTAKTKLESLKMKNEFSKDVKQLSDIIGSDLITSEFEEISREVDVEFNSNEFRLEDIENNREVKDIIKDIVKNEDLERFKEQIMGE